jgi:hypothetical protein
MVKRVIAAFAGAIAGALLWFAFNALASAVPDADVTVQACERGPLIDCVRFEAPVEAPRETEAATAVAAPCKGWLGGDARSLALLSECLHAARAKDRRPQAVAGSI